MLFMYNINVTSDNSWQQLLYDYGVRVSVVPIPKQILFDFNIYSANSRISIMVF